MSLPRVAAQSAGLSSHRLLRCALRSSAGNRCYTAEARGGSNPPPSAQSKRLNAFRPAAIEDSKRLPSRIVTGRSSLHLQRRRVSAALSTTAVCMAAAPEPPVREEVTGLVDAAQEALEAGEFVKATLTRYRGNEADLKSAHLKPVKIKGSVQLQVLFRYKYRDITKNFPLSESRGVMEGLFQGGFSMGNLYTTAGDWQLVVPKKQSKQAVLTRSRAAQTKAPSLDHNRTKPTHVSRDEPFMKALGLVDAEGRPRPDMASKLRQVDHFCEVLGHAVQDSSLASAKRLRIVDMGAGKGYLTFATHAFLSSGGGSIAGEKQLKERRVQTTGVEIRQDMVDRTNGIAQDSPGCEGLRFEKGTIAGWSRRQGVVAGADKDQVEKVDILIALHACDTATDDALFYGISAGAEIIVASPCCHKEVRRQFRQQEKVAEKSLSAGSDPELSPLGSGLKDVLRHGILAERQAELVTDALRAALLEAAGYRANVFEFVTGEHTSKNLMICAVKNKGSKDSDAREKAKARVADLLESFGIKHQRLAALTGVAPMQDGSNAGHPLVSFQD